MFLVSSERSSISKDHRWRIKLRSDFQFATNWWKHNKLSTSQFFRSVNFYLQQILFNIFCRSGCVVNRRVFHVFPVSLGGASVAFETQHVHGTRQPCSSVRSLCLLIKFPVIALHYLFRKFEWPNNWVTFAARNPNLRLQFGISFGHETNIAFFFSYCARE